MKTKNRRFRFAVIFLALCVVMTVFFGTVSFAADRLMGDADGIVHDGLFTRPSDRNEITRYLADNGLM